MKEKLYMERALFIIAPQNAGKTTQLKSMFADPRFGTNTIIPQSKRLPVITLSKDRRLYIRLSSPHEMKLSPVQFHKNIIASTGVGRWCFAGAFHPYRLNKMPDVFDALKLFKQKFNPERIRVCFLSPNTNKKGKSLTESEVLIISDKLRKIKGVEYMFIDARDEYANGLLLADFFDFS